MNTSSLQDFTQESKMGLAASNGMPMGLLPFLVFWWKGMDGLEVLGGLTMLFLMGFCVHW